MHPGATFSGIVRSETTVDQLVAKLEEWLVEDVFFTD